MTTSAGEGSYVADVQVRWSDCDPAGVVYYPNYFTLFEAALSQFMESRGATWTRLMVRHGIRFPRVEARARFRGPAGAGDRLRVAIGVAERRSRGLRLAFTIAHPDGRQVAEGVVGFVALSADAGAADGAVELPDEVVDLFSSLAHSG